MHLISAPTREETNVPLHDIKLNFDKSFRPNMYTVRPGLLKPVNIQDIVVDIEPIRTEKKNPEFPVKQLGTKKGKNYEEKKKN